MEDKIKMLIDQADNMSIDELNSEFAKLDLDGLSEEEVEKYISLLDSRKPKIEQMKFF